jgi:hypothetical protein
MILSFGAFQIAYFPALTVLGPEIARRSLGGAPAWALVVTGELIGGIVGGVIAVRTRSSRPLVLMCVVGMPIAVQLTALAFAWPLAVIAASAAVGGAGLAMSDAVWFTTLQRLIPDAALSRVSSFDWLGSMALNPLGYALIGPLAALVGTHATMGGAAVLLWVAALAPLAVPAVLNLRLPPADPEVT